MTITINGWPSFDAWCDAGYPGAVSFPAERKPDPRAGLCGATTDCPRVEEVEGMCWTHYMLGIERQRRVRA